ncbi:DUF1707 domain-containing protein [Blastococcus brunescens]|uniref:DUF1707 domain-containing protein n=1 Tax=Blastococcus brunescens TaxID=1564165 RepID=A0ABZ1B968_9ACTN|nr:DUF1707 domain-containing protein [Blastococcus sp. BMG 8361]WRL67340.1 DUF1707 domain-containing protein [Blastococcus sp. BMG 8361]
MTDDENRERPPAVRASDADREAVVSRLQAALAEGVWTSTSSASARSPPTRCSPASSSTS